MNERENWLRAVEFRYPEWIPVTVGFAPIMWKVYRGELEKVVLEHPRIFPDYEEGSQDFDEMPEGHREGEYFRDNWSCLWYNIQEGLEGQVVEHPLAEWSVLDTYEPPDPLTKAERGDRNWDEIRREVEGRKRQGLLTFGDGERLFDRLYFLRGFENLMMDFAEENPNLPRLIEMLTEHEMRLLRKWFEIGVDVMSFHTDIGTQSSLMISPAQFRKYVKPMFKKLFQACRSAGSHVSLSSDGRLLEIVDDLIECGVSVHDPQVRANTLEGIARAYKGRLCAKVDLDRQSFPFVEPWELREGIKQVIDVMAASEGGLMIWAWIGGADIPLRNIEAIIEALEEYCFP